MQKILKISNWFLWWIAYSIAGWVYEIIVVSAQEGHLVSRGFLYGPLCPIYGTAALMAIALLYRRVKHVVPLFLVGVTVATVLEYITSVVLERLFGQRWWDYSDFRFNIEGRVCLLATIVFGVMMILLIRVIHPRVEALTERIPAKTRIVLASVLAGLIAIDLWLTVIHQLAMR